MSQHTTHTEAALKTGTQVRTIYGAVETVLVAEPARIITYESAERNDWYHPSKVWPVSHEERRPA